MVYTKNHDPWADADTLTTGIMDNFESIYTEGSAYVSGHNHDATYPTRATMESTFWYAGNDGAASGADADKLAHGSNSYHAAELIAMGIPPGLIIMWSGSIASIPEGWHICDGSPGVRDLRDKFVMGAELATVATTGTGLNIPMGSVEIGDHILTAAEIKGHQHTYSDKYAATGGAGSAYLSGTGGHYSGLGTYTGLTTGVSDLPNATADAHTHSVAEGTAFTGTEFKATPPYYALAYIQKV